MIARKFTHAGLLALMLQLVLTCAAIDVRATPKGIPVYPDYSRVQCARILEKTNPYAQELKTHLVEYREALRRGDLLAVQAYLAADYPVVFPEMTAASGKIAFSALEPLFRGHFETLRSSRSPSTFRVDSRALSKAQRDRIQILELLLARMNEEERNWLDSQQENALHWAVREQYWEAIPHLIHAGLNIGQTSGAKGALQGDTFLDRALRGQFTSALASIYLIPRKNSVTAPQLVGSQKPMVFNPFLGGFIEPVSDLLPRIVAESVGVPIAEFPSQLLIQSGDSLLTYIVRNWDLNDSKRGNLQLLLEVFAQLGIRLPINEPERVGGRTALWFAAQRLDARAVELLVAHGADAEMRCDQTSEQASTTPIEEVRRRAALVRREMTEGKRTDVLRRIKLTQSTEDELERLRRVARALQLEDNPLSTSSDLN